MAYCRITHTSNGKKAIDYVLSGKPHNADKFVAGRVLSARGINCTVAGCRVQMRSVWRHFQIRKNQYHVQRLIISFDPQQLSYKSEKDKKIAQRIGDKVAKKLFPHQQSIVVEQADGKRHVLHLHIITSMTNFDDGYAMSGRQTSWRKIQPKVDRIVRGFKNSRGIQLDPTAHKHMINEREPASWFKHNDAEYHIKERGNYSWTADIKVRCKRALQLSWTWKMYISNCRKRGVTVNAFRKNGKLKKRTSYQFKDKNGKVRHIRSTRLGYAYDPQVITKGIFPAVKKYWAKVNERHHASEVASPSASIASASVSASISNSASVASSASASAENAKHDDDKRTFDFIRGHSVDKVMPKLHMNARRAMVNQIPLLPKMAQPKTKSKADNDFNNIDLSYHVSSNEHTAKWNWFQGVINAWRSFRNRIHDRWKSFEYAVKRWKHRAKQWIYGKTPGYGGLGGGMSPGRKSASATNDNMASVKQIFNSAHGQFTSFASSTNSSQLSHASSSASSAKSAPSSASYGHHFDFTPSSSSQSHGPSEDGPTL